MYFRRLIFIFVGLIALILLFAIIFGGHKKPAPANPLKPLPDYFATDASVSFTTDGLINGDDLHRQIRITIDANSRTLDIIQGYSGRVIGTKNFYNTQDAYRVFLKAINNEAFLAKNDKSKLPANPEGQCPLGFRYIFSLDQEGGNLFNSWTSSCGPAIGNSKTALDAITSLFQNQIPNYDTLTGNVDLSATGTD